MNNLSIATHTGSKWQTQGFFFPFNSLFTLPPEHSNLLIVPPPSQNPSPSPFSSEKGESLPGYQPTLTHQVTARLGASSSRQDSSVWEQDLLSGNRIRGSSPPPVLQLSGDLHENQAAHLLHMCGGGETSFNPCVLCSLVSGWVSGSPQGWSRFYQSKYYISFNTYFMDYLKRDRYDWLLVYSFKVILGLP
jgi:hypothetical protein